MATYCASVLLAELRRQKGFTQERLADGICDRRTISYIEKGTISPSKYIYEKLMQRLGVDPHRFACYISSGAEMRFEEVKHQIAQLFREKKEAQIEPLLQALEKDKLLHDNKFVTQYIIKTRAWILAGGMDWHNAADSHLPEMLDTALRLTCDSFDLENIKVGLYSIIEIDLIRMLGLVKLYTGEKREACGIFADLEDIIQTGYIYSREIAGAYASVLVSLAKSYRWLGQYDKALAASQRGVDMCVTRDEYRTLPWLLYQKASALFWLGEREQSCAILDEAIILARNYREIEFADFVGERKQAMEEGRF